MSENRSLQSATSKSEDETYLKLRRRPVKEVWSDFMDIVLVYMREHKTSEINLVGIPELEEWVKTQGWSSVGELISDSENSK